MNRGARKTRERRALGRRIARARRNADLTAEALAAALGVTRPTIDNWESGRSEPDATQITEIAVACDVGYGFFFDAKPNVTVR